MDADFVSLLGQLRRALHADARHADARHADGADIGRLMPVARKQAVDGMLFDIPGVALPADSGTRMRLVASLMALERHNRWMDAQVASLARRLDDHGVCYAVMKGQTCAAFYPHPLHRRSGDVDVYVAPHDFDRANAMLVRWGAQLVDRTMLHSTYRLGQLDVEVHFAVQKLQYVPYYRRLRRITAEEFDSAAQTERMDIGGYGVRVLPDVLNIVLLTTHAFNHVITAGLGLRQVIDWQVVLAAKAATLDWPRLMRYLDMLHLRRMFLVLVHVNVRYLGMDGGVFVSHGLDINAPGVRRMARRLMGWMATCGNFGHGMHLGSGVMYSMRYYALFMVNITRFFWLSPMEMMAWPWMKAYRAITHTNHL